MAGLRRGRRRSGSDEQVEGTQNTDVSTTKAQDEARNTSESPHVASSKSNGKRKRGKATLADHHEPIASNDEEEVNSAKDTKASESEKKQMSAQEEADLSSALIAKLLAEEGGGGGQYMDYYDDYGNGGGYNHDPFDDYASANDADDDWDPSNKKRRSSKGGRGAAQKTRKHAGGDSGPDDVGSSSNSDISDGERRSRKKKKTSSHKRQPKEKLPPAPIAPGQYRSGGYTDEEEEKFGEGLELFGRDWNRISEHVVTRDPKSIRSHAQKYFIKLFRDKIPLPAKVLESGEGYTLSGRPLDPNSAAARPYLQHVMQLDPPTPKQPSDKEPTRVNNSHDVNKAFGEGAVNGATDKAEAGDMSGSSRPVPSSVDNNDNKDVIKTGSHASATDEEPKDKNKTSPEPTTPDTSSKTAASAQENNFEVSLPKSPVRTEYALNRPQRSHARTALPMKYNDPHQMIRCTPFSGTPLSGTPGSQPFKIDVHTNAQLQMDFHAHLMLSEIIGLLGGQWDAEAKKLIVMRAFPCRALETAEAHTNVEMDPESELLVRQEISDAGLRVVGWYHSHPTFRPDPSFIDIENQLAYQTLFRDDTCSEEPFVGAIVGPYDPNLPGPVSVFNWFYVSTMTVDRGHPKRLTFDTVNDETLPDNERDILLSLFDDSLNCKHRVAFDEAWKPLSTELRSLKMAVSLACRMPWLITLPDNSDDANTPAEPLGMPVSEAEPQGATNEKTPADSDASSESTANETESQSEKKAESIDKQIPHASLVAGHRAVNESLLVMLSKRFSVGLFKAGPDGEINDSERMERVFAAYFTQWASGSLKEK